MSNTEALRAAAQAALECLESLQGGCTDSGDGTVEAITVWCPGVIDALRAALARPADPVVERADSATPVVERSAGNVSDYAATVAPAEPAVWLAPKQCPTPRACEHNGMCHGTCAAPQPAPAPRLRWAEAPRRTEWGAGMMEALIALGTDETLRLYANQDAVPMVNALLSAHPAPARVPLYDQAALDAALNLWPRDCRLCAHFTTQTGGCTSAVQCVDSAQFKTTPPRQYWAAGPNVGAKAPT